MSTLAPGESMTAADAHLTDLVERLAEDPAFRAEFGKDPVAAAALAGFEVPEPIVRQILVLDDQVAETRRSEQLQGGAEASAGAQDRLLPMVLRTPGVRGPGGQG